MKQKTAILIILLVIGMLFGSLIGEIFSKWIPLLNKSQQIFWHPKADLNILKYDFYVQVKLNLASIIGLGIAFWIYKKL